MDLDLKDVHVLVTGGNSGLGSETCRVFLEQGALVTATYRNSNTALSELAKKYDGTRLRIIQADLASESVVQGLFAAVPRPVEVLVVNHAVYNGFAMVKDITLDRWRNTIDNNLTSAFLVTREYIKGLEGGIAANKPGERFGERAAIVFIGSTSGKFGQAFSSDYASTKSALMYGFTLSLKNEIVKVAPRGRVNAVAPGWMNTPSVAYPIAQPGITYPSLATTPLKKVAQPADVAQQVVILASSKVSGHVTGQVLSIDGGMEGRVQNMPTDLGMAV